MLGFNHLVQCVIDVSRHIDQIHAGRCHHHIASGEIRHAKHAFEHDAALCIDHLFAFGIGQSCHKLFAGIGTGA